MQPFPDVHMNRGRLSVPDNRASYKSYEVIWSVFNKPCIFRSVVIDIKMAAGYRCPVSQITGNGLQDDEHRKVVEIMDGTIHVLHLIQVKI